MINEKYNVCLITLDSLRFDVAKSAKLPFLSSISQRPVKAETDGTYTYPAHHALFTGRMPRRYDQKEIIKGFKTIWRPEDSKSHKTHLVTTTKATIMEHYRSLGYQVLGVGGVQFFNPDLTCNLLPLQFEEYAYFGPNKNIPEPQLIPRTKSQLPSCNIEHIANRLQQDRSFFLFINFSETHTPYDVPNTIINEQYEQTVSKYYAATQTKKRYPVNNLPLSTKERLFLMDAQKNALEWVDSQLAVLFANLPRSLPKLTLIMADHGEEFGEHGRYGHGYPSPQVMQIPLWAGIVT